MMRSFSEVGGWSRKRLPLAAGLVVIIAGGVYFTRFGELTVPAIASDDDLRSWIGALSGWAALVAAALTIRAMYKQIDQANRQHRDMVDLTVMSRLTMIKLAWKEALSLGSNADQLKADIIEREPTTSSHEMSSFILARFEFLLRRLHHRVFDDFEAQVGIYRNSALDVVTMRSMLDSAVDRLSNSLPQEEDGNEPEVTSREAILILTSLGRTAKTIEDVAFEFQLRWTDPSMVSEIARSRQV